MNIMIMMTIARKIKMLEVARYRVQYRSYGLSQQNDLFLQCSSVE